jgi:hypothetical protein
MLKTNPTPQQTDFSLDVLGRYVCNSLQEALLSTDGGANPEARPFDMIIIGGGSFGSVLASHLFSADTSRSHRILVLEAGPFVYPEHVQNLPPGFDGGPVWNVPWIADPGLKYQGLAFCLGGRSVLWGGWSPRFIDSEYDDPSWPDDVKRDLTQRVVPPKSPKESYLDQASRQIGTDDSNDFVFGPLHTALRATIYKGLTTRGAEGPALLTGNRGRLDSAADLEAPLAVQSGSARAGFFPFNKFNGVQLIVRAARQAQNEAQLNSSPGHDMFKKRLFVVDNTRVLSVERVGRKITRIITDRGPLQVDENAKVFLALGTIESTRLALQCLANENQLIGRNLMAHLRSNVTIRVPRASFPELDPAADPRNAELQISALFVKGIQELGGGRKAHFHVQITASGVGDFGNDSEAELFKKIPNIDELDRFDDLTDKWVVVTFRGIGEMFGDKTPAAANRITLEQRAGGRDFDQRRAVVNLTAGPPGSEQQNLWDVMDLACIELAGLVGKEGEIQYLYSSPTGSWWDTKKPSLEQLRKMIRDALGTTHHESGSLWMGTDPGSSVTDQWGRFWESDNLYAVGPALLPRIGSPNPMLSGVALTRRTGDHVLKRNVTPAEAGFISLFDGSDASFGRWLMAGQGTFALVDGHLIAQPGGDIGLLYYAARQFGDFVLRAQFMLKKPTGDGNDNSGIYVRFRDPRLPREEGGQPYANQAYVAVQTGFEVQIDEEARGNKTLTPPEADGLDFNRTGAIYKAADQAYARGAHMQPAEWYEFEIEVTSDVYVAKLRKAGDPDFVRTTRFEKPATDEFKSRGLTPAQDLHSGFIGIQVHTGSVAFRNIRIKPA